VKQHQENNTASNIINKLGDKMKNVWQVEVTNKPMDEKNELKMMEMGLQVCKNK
jgi:hypothetical protein